MRSPYLISNANINDSCYLSRLVSGLPHTEFYTWGKFLITHIHPNTPKEQRWRLNRQTYKLEKQELVAKFKTI